MAWEVTSAKVNPTVVILLNGHAVNGLLNTYVYATDPSCSQPCSR